MATLRKHLRFEDHFSQVSREYARYRPQYPPELAELLGRCAPDRSLAVDLGCGSGQLSVCLASCFERVIGIDASEAQIAAAEPHSRVAYSVGAAERTGLPDHCADLIAVAQSLHWFRLADFWPEARRIGRPGALLAIIGYGLMRIEPEIDRLVDAFHDEALAPFWPPERWSVVRGYADVEIPFPENPVDDIPPLHARWQLAGLLGYVATWSGVRKARSAGAAMHFERFSEALAERWGDPSRPRAVRWPLQLRLARLPVS